MKSKIKFTTRFIYCCSFQFKVLCRNFLNATNFKDRPTVDAKNSAKCGANLLVVHWKHWTPITKVTMPSLWDFADPQGEFNKLLVYVQEKNFDCAAPPFNHISGICKNLAGTWPAATRVLSRSRERTLGTRLSYQSNLLTIPGYKRRLSERCNLCLWEKYLIICRPELATLNRRNELVSSCRHVRKYLLSNLICWFTSAQHY